MEDGDCLCCGVACDYCRGPVPRRLLLSISGITWITQACCENYNADFVLENYHNSSGLGSGCCWQIDTPGCPNATCLKTVGLCIQLLGGPNNLIQVESSIATGGSPTSNIVFRAPAISRPVTCWTYLDGLVLPFASQSFGCHACNASAASAMITFVG